MAHRGVVADAGGHDRLVSGLLYLPVGHRGYALALEGILSRGAAEPVRGGAAIAAGEADSGGWVEGSAAGSHIDADSAGAHVLVAGAGFDLDAEPEDILVASFAAGAEALGVDLVAVGGHLVAVTEDADLVGLADPVFEGALALVVEKVVLHALVAVLGDEVVELAVEEGVGAGSVPEPSPLLATSKRVGDQPALSVDYGGVLVVASDAVSGDVIPGLAEGRDLDAEETVGRGHLSGGTDDLLADSQGGGPPASDAGEAPVGDLVETGTLLGDVGAGGPDQILVVSADDDGGGAGPVGEQGVAADATGAEPSIIAPGCAKGRHILAGVVDNVLPVSADDRDCLADSESVDRAGVVLAGLAVSGEGIVGVAEVADGEAGSKGEVESVGAGVVVDAGSVDELIAGEAGEALQVDSVVVDAGEALLVSNGLVAGLHVGIGVGVGSIIGTGIAVRVISDDDWILIRSCRCNDENIEANCKSTCCS